MGEKKKCCPTMDRNCNRQSHFNLRHYNSRRDTSVPKTISQSQTFHHMYEVNTEYNNLSIIFYINEIGVTSS